MLMLHIQAVLAWAPMHERDEAPEIDYPPWRLVDAAAHGIERD